MESLTLSPSVIKYLKTEGYENYKKVRYWTDEEGPNDPEDDPFRSTYKARALLQEILGKVQREQSSSDASLKILAAAVQYQLGINYIHAEERPAGEDCLEKCLQLVADDIALMKEAVSIALSAYTELGILWASRYLGGDKALRNLEKVDNLYHKYKHEVGELPLGIHEILSSEKDSLTDLQREARFEKIYTHALYYLTQVHSHFGDYDLAARYGQRTLRQQIIAKEYDPQEWAMNAATLSRYYSTRSMFHEAKHLLSCANVIIDEAKLPEGLGEPSPDDDEKTAIHRKKVDIARCWVQYFLALLEYSKERLWDDVCELDGARQAETIEDPVRLNDEDDPQEWHRIPLEVGAIEDAVRHKPATTFEESRELFRLGKKYVDIALEFFVMDGYVTENVELLRDMSSLYKHIIFFEKEKGTQCKLLKRRVDLLSAVLKEINPQFYLHICQELQIELGAIHCEMLELKIAIANECKAPATAHAVKKINTLCRSSIFYFRTFLDTLKTSEKVFPTTFEIDVEHSAIIANFNLGRLHSILLTPVKAEKQSFTQQSLEYYKWIVDYVDRNPKCEPAVQKEANICREMLVLLPNSVEHIMEQAGCLASSPYHVLYR